MTEREIRLSSGWPFLFAFALLLPGGIVASIVMAARTKEFLPYGLAIIVLSLVWLIGIWAIVFGVALIVLGLQVRKAAKTVTAG